MDPQVYLTQTQVAGPASRPGFERFDGFAILGVTFESGHMLALRNFERSNAGPAFTAVWMREPGGDWRFFSTNPPAKSCAQYMLPDVADQTPIDIRWVNSSTLHVSIKEISFRWFVEFEESRRTRWLSSALGRLPEGALRSPAVSRIAALAARATLRTGTIRLHGAVPNGQQFAGLPRRAWQVKSSTAWTSTYNFGGVVRPGRQERFGDFWLPATPIAMAGAIEFEPLPEVARAARAPLAA